MNTRKNKIITLYASQYSMQDGTYFIGRHPCFTGTRDAIVGVVPTHNDTRTNIKHCNLVLDTGAQVTIMCIDAHAIKQIDDFDKLAAMQKEGEK